MARRRAVASACVAVELPRDYRTPEAWCPVHPVRRVAAGERQCVGCDLVTGRAAAHAIGDVTLLAAEQAGFTYRDGRDTSGFIDGTDSLTEFPGVSEATIWRRRCRFSAKRLSRCSARNLLRDRQLKGVDISLAGLDSSCHIIPD